MWHNEDKNFLVWVNEEDHMRVISMQKDGNMHQVFTRWCDGLNKFEAAVKEDGNDDLDWGRAAVSRKKLGEPPWYRPQMGSE